MLLLLLVMSSSLVEKSSSFFSLSLSLPPPDKGIKVISRKERRELSFSLITLSTRAKVLWVCLRGSNLQVDILYRHSFVKEMNE